MDQEIASTNRGLYKQPIISDWSNITKDNPRSITALHCVFTIDLSPDGKYIASAGGVPNFAIQIWDPNTGVQVGQNLEGHTNSIWAIQYSKCGNFIVSCSSDHTIRQWSTITFQQIGQTLIGHSDRVLKVQYSFDQRLILSCSDDKTVRIWNQKTGLELVHKRINHPRNVQSLALSQTTTQVVFGDFNAIIYIWDYKLHKQCRQLIGHTNGIYYIKYSIDSKLILTCSDDQSLRIWDVATGQQIGNSLLGHTGDFISYGSFSPNMMYIISGGSDTTVRIWNRLTGKQIGASMFLHNNTMVNTAQFSLDGKYIITGGYDRQIKIMLSPVY